VDPRVVLTIIGMSLLTYVPRMLPAVLLSRRKLPGPMLTWLGFLPPAILSALVAQEVFIHEGRLAITADNPALVPAVVTAIVAWRTQSLAWTVVAGLGAAALYGLLYG